MGELTLGLTSTENGFDRLSKPLACLQSVSTSKFLTPSDFRCHCVPRSHHLLWWVQCYHNKLKSAKTTCCGEMELSFLLSVNVLTYPYVHGPANHGHQVWGQSPPSVCPSLSLLVVLPLMLSGWPFLSANPHQKALITAAAPPTSPGPIINTANWPADHPDRLRHQRFTCDWMCVSV